MTETLEQRIARERRELRLGPWEMAPSEAGDYESPWPPGTAGYAGWQRARAMRAQIRQRDPHYFDDGDA